MSVLCMHCREARKVCCPKYPAFTKQGERLGNRFVIPWCRCSSVSNSEVKLHKHDKRDVEASGQGGTGASHICCNFCLFCFCFQDKILLFSEADLNSKPTHPPPPPCLNLPACWDFRRKSQSLVFHLQEGGEISWNTLYPLPPEHTPWKRLCVAQGESAESLKEVTWSRLTQTHSD